MRMPLNYLLNFQKLVYLFRLNETREIVYGGQVAYKTLAKWYSYLS
ncbi:hypothetical protein GCM10010038_35780 [Glutamicibacter protophormiae]|nr:hypothetical protein GCM10010038_35780 [Glutamicibacter protophormiae]